MNKLSDAQQRGLKKLTKEWANVGDIMYVSTPTLDSLVKKGLAERKYETNKSHYRCVWYRLPPLKDE